MSSKLHRLVIYGDIESHNTSMVVLVLNNEQLEGIYDEKGFDGKLVPR